MGETAAGEYAFQNGLGEPLAGLEGCERVPFSPSLQVFPVEEEQGAAPGAALSAASMPAGMNVTVRLPAEAQGLGEAAVRDTTVALPGGVQLSPSGANGLQACSEAQVGFEGESSSPDPLSPGAVEGLRFSDAPAACPAASKVGVVRIRTPDLAHELQGGVYIAESAPNGEVGKNPFGSLFAVYIAAEDPVSKVLVKLAGEVVLNQETGQITSTFKDTPQVPFEELELHFFEGPRASLSTPAFCGVYSSEGLFTPWSAGQPVLSAAGFQITSGAGGGACADPLTFAPSLTAGMLDPQAGAFSPFTLTIARPDGNQALRGLTVRLPAGVAAVIASLTPCPEPQAAAGQCGPESLIGPSTAIAGLGSEPITLPGRAYLTGPYKGAPFGIEVLTPAVAGPFNLGDVIVRSRINVDPNTAAVTIASDLIPTILKGVPAQIKELNVTANRPGFEFNPTNCSPARIQADLSGSEGATASVSSPFQVTGCQSLPFAPKLTAIAGGHGSKANGTSLDVTVTSGGINSGGVAQAGIAKVDLQLPKALSSRLSTLQKACTEAVFDANPASCDEASVIGNATIHTPVLKSPLSGPAYLVSHGGAQFPDVEFVLQGEGITLILDGKTDIKDGITYSRFESTPDAPFTIFETVLPAGPHGVLTPNVSEKEDFSLCKTSLQMPTEITSQNGIVISRNTSIALSGCAGVLSAKSKLTNAELLVKALKACRKDKHKRLACEKRARRRYPKNKASHKPAKTK
jgi:hypothetical protein